MKTLTKHQILKESPLSGHAQANVHSSTQKRGSRLSYAVDAFYRGGPVSLVCLPSLTFDPAHIKSILGITHYEIRCLWEVLNASKEHVEVIFISTKKIPTNVFEDMLSNLPNPKSAKDRIRLLSVDDSGLYRDLPLVEKVMKNSRALKTLQKELKGKTAFLKCFMTTEKEERLAQLIDAPVWGMDSDLSYYHSKSGNHALFEQADIPCADNIRDIKSIRSLKAAIKKLWARWPDARRFMFKFDHGVSGNGIALMNLTMNYNQFFDLEVGDKDKHLDSLISSLEFKEQRIPLKEFTSQIKEGAVLERFFEGESKTSPSGQAVIYPDGRVEVLSTHEQILADCGVTYLGCEFPAKESYRKEVENYTREVAKALSFNGVIGPLSVDFLVVKAQNKSAIYAIEVNIRQGGTTHPFQTASALLGAKYDFETGSLIDEKGKRKVYLSNDNLILNGKKGQNFKALQSLLGKHHFNFCKKKKEGFVFHMMSAVEDFGKCGYTLIGKDHKKIERLQAKLKRVLIENDFVISSF